MSRPVSPAVYRRRRLTVLAIAVLLILGIWWAASSVFGSDPETPVKSKPTPTATGTPTPQAQGPGEITVGLTSSDKACKPTSIRITPSVPEGQLAGGPVKINLLVSTTEAKGCTLTPDKADLLVVISQKVAVYDSSVCKGQSMLKQNARLSAGFATIVPIEWSGKGSGRACAPEEGFSSPGQFRLQIGTLGGEPGETNFSLAAPPPPPAPVATPAPEAPAV